MICYSELNLFGLYLNNKSKSELKPTNPGSSINIIHISISSLSKIAVLVLFASLLDLATHSNPNSPHKSIFHPPTPIQFQFLIIFKKEKKTNHCTKPDPSHLFPQRKTCLSSPIQLILSSKHIPSITPGPYPYREKEKKLSST